MRYAATDIRVDIGGATLLDGVSVAIERGRMVAILGPNGAGKSTLIRTLAGELRPRSGSVELDGRPLGAFEPLALARRRSVMGADRPVAFAYTAAQVALLGRAPHHGGRPSAADRSVIADLLDAVDMAALAERLYASLSTGERQRVQLARAIAQVTVAPDAPGSSSAEREGSGYLLLDEPTSSLDPAHQHAAMRLMRAQVDRGHGVAAVLHDLNLAVAYADEVVLMRSGRVVATGAPAAVMRPETLEAVFDMPMLVLPHPSGAAPIIVPRLEGAASAD